MFKVLIGDRSMAVNITPNSVELDGKKLEFDLSSLSQDRYHLLLDHKSYTLEIVSNDQKTREMVIKVNNKEVTVVIETALDELLAKMGLNTNNKSIASDIAAPMPGLILEIAVNVGDEVRKGDKLLILEAMKMENLIKAPADGRIKSVTVKTGESVESGQKLIGFF